MTTFSHIFRSTRDLAISQGRRPVVCYLGPDFQEEFREFARLKEDFLQKFAPNEPWGNAIKPGDLGALCGVQLRKMDLPGMAILTAPAPESGFDSTP